MRLAYDRRPSLIARLSLLALCAVAGAAHAAAPLTPMPASVTFPDTGTGAQSQEVMVNFTNGGNAGVTLQSFSLGGTNPGDFVLDTSNFPPPIAVGPGVTIPVGVTFKPLLGGARSATLVATLGNNQGTVSVPLSGNAIGPKITVTPNPISAGGTKLNVATMTKVTIANAGGGTVDVSAVGLSGVNAADFTLSGFPTLPVALTASQSFSGTITFSPTTAGAHTATLTVTSDDPNTPSLAVPVKGLAGDPAIASDIGTLAFGNVKVGASSMPQPINISNTGDSDLHITSVTVGGANPGDFVIDKTGLPMTLPVGTSGRLFATFAPTAVGARAGRIVIASDDPVTPMKTIGLLGTGTYAKLAVMNPTLDFMSVRLYGASAAQSLVVTNTGTDFANVIGMQFAGAQSTWFHTNPAIQLPLKVPAGGSVKIDITAVPLGLGAGTAQLMLMTDDPMDPSLSAQVSVTATSGNVTVTPGFVDFGFVGVLGMQMQTVTVANAGTDVLNITDFQLNDMTGMYTVPDVPTLPAALMPGQMLQFTVAFSPMSAGAFNAEVDLVTDDPMAKFVHIPLDGTGAVAMLSTSPTMLNFNMELVNQLSAPQTVTLSNMGAEPVAIASVAISGANQGQFRFDDPGAFTLAPNKTRTIAVQYSPISAGAHTANLVITPMGFAALQVKLTGMAVSPVLQLAQGQMMVDFGAVTLGTSSDPVAIGIHNGGSAPFTIGSIASSLPDYTIDTSATTLTMMGGATSKFGVTFTPTAAGTRAGTITITLKGATTAIATVQVTGAGIPKRVTTGCSMSQGRAVGGARGALAMLAPAMLLVALALSSRRRPARG